MTDVNPHGLGTPFPSPAELLCDDCGRLIKRKSPVLFNAAQELVHWDCRQFIGEHLRLSTMQQYADLGKAYIAHAERVPEDHPGRAANYREAAKYLLLAARALPFHERG